MRSISITLVLSGMLLTQFNVKSSSTLPNKIEPTCAYPNGRPTTTKEPAAKCYGYDPCDACSDCSRCGHCNSGGSCGACSTKSKKTYYTQKSTGARSSSPSPARTTRHTPVEVPSTYPKALTNPNPKVYVPSSGIVSAAQLNIRSGPGTNFEIIGTLVQGDRVKITEVVSENWVKIEVSIEEGNALTLQEGYVYRKFLTF